MCVCVEKEPLLPLIVRGKTAVNDSDVGEIGGVADDGDGTEQAEQDDERRNRIQAAKAAKWMARRPYAEIRTRPDGWARVRRSEMFGRSRSRQARVRECQSNGESELDVQPKPRWRSTGAPERRSQMMHPNGSGSEELGTQREESG